MGRRIRVAVGSEQYDQETYFGMWFIPVRLPTPPHASDALVGIPFATPPLGNLRFHPPVPLPDDETRVVDAYEHGFTCMQPINVGKSGHFLHSIKL